MQNRKLLLGMFFLIIFCILYFAIYDKGTVNEESRVNYTTDESVLKILNEIEEIALKSIEIKNDTVYDIENKPFLLKQLLDNDTKLIFKFSESNCSLCIDHSLRYIEKYQNKIGVANIIIIGDFFNRKSFLVFSKLNPLIQSKVYKLNKEVLELPIDDLNKPYLFSANPFLEIDLFFVPLKEIPKRTDDFFLKLPLNFAD